MSPNNLTILYAGLDVAKATLQLDLRGVSYALENTPKGHARILRLLAEAEQAARPGTRLQVVLEATGGYEAALVAALHAADRLVSVIPPARARHFAQAGAEHAKSDPIDAAVLSAFGAAMEPPPTPPASQAQRHLAALVGRRAQLVATRVSELNRAEHYTEKLLRAQSRALLARLDRQIAACDKAIAAQIAAEEPMKTRAARVQQVPGIGAVTAAILQAHLPSRPSAFPHYSPPPPRWAPSATARLPPSPGSPPTIATAARAKACALSAAGAPPCAARSTPSASLRAFGMAAMSAIRHDAIPFGFAQGRLCAPSPSGCAPPANSRWWRSPPSCANSSSCSTAC